MQGLFSSFCPLRPMKRTRTARHALGAPHSRPPRLTLARFSSGKGVKGETGSRTRSAARRASTERVRISGPQARPLTHLERPKPQVMGADKEAKRPAGCTLDDRGRLAPFPPGREGRGDGWRARNAPSLPLELLLLPKSKTNSACNALQGPQTKTLPPPLAYLLNASPAACALRCRLFWARWWCPHFLISRFSAAVVLPWRTFSALSFNQSRAAGAALRFAIWPQASR